MLFRRCKHCLAYWNVEIGLRNYQNGQIIYSDLFLIGKPRIFVMSDIAEKVKAIVVEHLGVEADKVSDTASFIDDLGADSLDNVELVMAFEEEFGVEIPDDAAEKIVTVKDAITFIEEAS